MPSQDILRDRTYQFSLDILNLAKILPNTRAAWIIEDQLIRAACSVGANHREAKSSSSRLEYKKFFEISLKSANETIYWLNLLRDSEMVGEDKILPLLKEVEELAKMLGKSVLTLKAKKV